MAYLYILVDPASGVVTAGTTPATSDPTLLDELVASYDGSYGLVTGANATGSARFSTSKFDTGTSLPTDFSEFQDFETRFRYQIQGLTNDTEELYTTLYRADSALSNLLFVAITTTSISPTTSSYQSFVLTDSTDYTDSIQDILTIDPQIGYTHTASMGADGSQWSIDTFEIRVSYYTKPTVALTTPNDASSDSDTTPTFTFTGTINSGTTRDAYYQIQIDSTNTFDSQTNAFSVKYLHAFMTVTGTGGSYKFEIRDGLDGNLLATSDTLAVNLTNIRYTWTFATPYTLAKNTTYYFHCVKTDGRSSTNFASWVCGQDYPPSFNNYYHNGSGWNTGTTDKDYGLEIEDSVGGVHVSSLRTSNNFGQTNPSVLPIFGVSGSNERACSSISFSYAPLINSTSHEATSDWSDASPPTPSGTSISYTVPAGKALAPGTYYWRVRCARATDRSTKSGHTVCTVYGAWSATRSFTVTGGTPSEPPIRRFPRPILNF